MEHLEKARRAVEAALDRKAEDLVTLDVRGLASFADVFVIATGRSDRQVRAIADAIEEALGRAGETPLGIEGYAEGRWVLMDFQDLIVHVFQPEARSFYDLDRLWGEAARIEFAALRRPRSAP